VCKKFANDHIMDIFTETVNFILASILKHRKFVTLLEEVENDCGEIIYYTYVRWLYRECV
jgi:hypothetical protein